VYSSETDMNDCSQPRQPVLTEPRRDWREEAIDYFQECVEAGLVDLDCMLTLVRDDWDEYLQRVEKDRGGDWLDDRVPQTYYWYVQDGRIVGRIRLRHRLNDRLEKKGGHIGYDVRPGEWGKGHATRMLQQMLEIARDEGFGRVLLTCDDDNLASARVIEKCGGVLQDTIPSPRSGKPHRRYWIDLSPS
jgi:predicted acetyltransferase